MIQIRVSGAGQEQRALARKVIRFCISEMMPRKRNLEIEMRLGKIDAYGYCMHVDNNSFELDIHTRQSKKNFIKTICHEMVHVRQYARGQLFESTRYGMMRWNGRYLKRFPRYENQPWEKEAHQLEDELYKKWLTCAV